MKYLISYSILRDQSVRAGHAVPQFGNMVTEMSPAQWLKWARTENWNRERHAEFGAHVTLINAWKISDDMADELEEIVS